MAIGHLPSFSLTGTVSVVTGASRGIGEGLAHGLAGAGSAVAVTARSIDDAGRVADAIVDSGGLARPYALDVTDLAGLPQVVEAISTDLGPPDVFVGNAGLGDNTPALDVTEDDWDRMMDVNLKGLFFSAQAFGRGMVERGSGRVILMSSQASLVGIEEHAVYSTSKGGVNQLVRVLALEWGPLGVTVNGVAPTFIHTPGTAERLDDPDYRQAVVDRIPVGDVGAIADVVGAVVYLASEAGRMVNGSILTVDGGWTAR